VSAVVIPARLEPATNGFWALESEWIRKCTSISDVGVLIDTTEFTSRSLKLFFCPAYERLHTDRYRNFTAL